MAHAQSAGGVAGSAAYKELDMINKAQGTTAQQVAQQQAAWTVPANSSPAATTPVNPADQAKESERQYMMRYTTATNTNTDNGTAGTGEEQWPGAGAGQNPGGGGGGGGSRSSSTTKNAYKAAVLPSATSQESYINAMYDANEAKKKAALEAQYAANVGALDQQAAKIPAQYDSAANQAAAQAAINRANFNEMAAASGLNTGAAGQAALAQNNALLGAVSEIRKNQANALNDVEAQRVSLQQQYQAAIKEAIANNEADRAAALYNEAKRVDESLVSTAVNQATENYRAWQAMYG